MHVSLVVEVAPCFAVSEIIISLPANWTSVSKLKPVAYTFQGKPTHGLIAQQVLQAYQDVQETPVGVYVPNDPQKEHYQLDYGLLITPLIKAVQQLAARIDDLENR